MKKPRIYMVYLALLSTQVLTSCGYTMRGGERPFFARRHIHTLYIPPVKNDSFKSGVEILVYNTIRKRFAQGGYVRIIDNPNLADAKLLAVIQDASSQPKGPHGVDSLAPQGPGQPSTVLVASRYDVLLKVQLSLIGKKDENIWDGTFSRNKPFQAATYFGSLGNTSALINESQFDDTLVTLADSVIADAEDSMNTVF